MSATVSLSRKLGVREEIKEFSKNAGIKFGEAKEKSKKTYERVSSSALMQRDGIAALTVPKEQTKYAEMSFYLWNFVASSMTVGVTGYMIAEETGYDTSSEGLKGAIISQIVFHCIVVFISFLMCFLPHCCNITKNEKTCKQTYKTNTFVVVIFMMAALLCDLASVILALESDAPAKDSAFIMFVSVNAMVVPVFSYLSMLRIVERFVVDPNGQYQGYHGCEV